jgi:hypothetical protein
MRTIGLALILLAACEEHGTRGPDAAVDDAGNLLIDAAPLPPPPGIAQACAAACDKIALCEMQMPTPECNTGCAADLADCTPQQVMDVQNCAAMSCGTGPPENSPFIMCIEAIACIQ